MTVIERAESGDAVVERGVSQEKVVDLVLPTTSTASLTRFARATIAPGSVIVTDDRAGYGPVASHGYTHRVLAPKALVLPHLVASLVKRWLLGTYQGAVKPTHLAYYLDEFTFRFNRRTSRSRGKLFYRLVQHALHVDPVPGKALRALRPTAADDDYDNLDA